ncbi:hypothetical protein Agabi119p4_9742 [Agaricus bisporus var. burnettii]|uniref:Uncharacterized protein n=1 Tax=Agaricus bisporus var. burnettii TaxID=192524 RepID=A0A8H7C476_AGABI|nr:hypothetical protein Agabi119p4_9742 [Agaricus bisporus var. burnettii]
MAESSSKVLCTCGCGKNVSYSTRLSHLRGQTRLEIGAMVLDTIRELHDGSLEGQKRRCLLPPDAAPPDLAPPDLAPPDLAPPTHDNVNPTFAPTDESCGQPAGYHLARVMDRSRDIIQQCWGDHPHLDNGEGGKDGEGGGSKSGGSKSEGSESEGSEGSDNWGSDVGDSTNEEDDEIQDTAEIMKATEKEKMKNICLKKHIGTGSKKILCALLNQVVSFLP